MHKTFVRPHLDYGDILYNQAHNGSFHQKLDSLQYNASLAITGAIRAHNGSFHQKLDSLQYNASLAITGAIRGSSREKLYQELGFESLQQRSWQRKLCI